MDKKSSRIRRARRTRAKIRQLGIPRLTVFRTPRHIYAQLIDDADSRVVASASTLSKDLRSAIANGGNVDAAAAVGRAIAARARDAGISEVAFDRAGFKYHGRVKALADAARENGLHF